MHFKDHVLRVPKTAARRVEEINYEVVLLVAFKIAWICIGSKCSDSKFSVTSSQGTGFA